MKFLRNRFLNFEKDEKHRFIFNENNENSESTEETSPLETNSILSRRQRTELTSDEEIKEELLDILENPIKFSFRDIRFLEKNMELIERDKSLKKKLQDLAVYYLSFAQSKILKKMPPRILYQIAGSRRIRKNLPLVVLKSMDEILEKDIERLKEFSKKQAENWSVYETAQVCALYRHLQKKSLASGVLSPLFESVTKKLAEKAIQFSIRNSAGNVISMEGDNSITTSERLILWEIRKILPPEVWAETQLSHNFTDFGKIEANKLLEDILDEKSGVKNNADLILLWDILEDLGSEPDSFFQLSEKKQAVLRSLVLRGNAAQFFCGIEDQPILLPLHLKALAELRGNGSLQEAIEKGAAFSSEIFSQWKDQDKKSFKKHEKEIETLSEEENKIKQQGIEETLNSSEITKDKKEEYEQAREVFEQKWQETFEPVFNTVKEKFRENPNFKFKLEKYFRAYERSEGNRKEQLEQASHILSELQNLFGKNEENEATNLLRENETLLNQFDDVLSEIKPSYSDFEDKEKVLMDSAQKNIKEKIEKIEEKRKKIKEKYAKNNTEDVFLEKIVDNFTEVKEKADKIDENYWNSLDNRLKNHRLHAADMEVVWHLKDADGLAGSSGEKTEAETRIESDSRFDNFREKFQSVLNQQLDQIQFDTSILDDRIIGNEIDHFLPWIDEVDRFLSVGELIKAMKNEGFDVSNQNPQIISELIKGAINFNKEHILNVLEAKLEEVSLMDNDMRKTFLNKLRIHHKISSPQEIQSVNTAYDQYFTNREANVSEIQEERNKMDGALTSIFGENISDLMRTILKKDLSRQEIEWTVQGLINGTAEANEDEEAFIMRTLEPLLESPMSTETQQKVLKHLKILRAFHQNQKWFQDGTASFPGTDKLNEARLQMEPIRYEMTQVMRGFSDAVSEIRELCKDKEFGNVKFVEFFETWKQETKPSLKKIIASTKNECDLLFGNQNRQFFETYFNNLNDALNTIDETVLGIESNFKNGYEFSGTESEFEILEKGRDFFNKYLSFRDGFWAMEEYQRKEELKQQSKTVTTLNSFGLFDDEYDENGVLVKKGSEKATEKFKKLQADYGEKYNDFRENIRSVKSIIENDIAKYDDDYFEQKYMTSKEAMEDLLKLYDDRLDEFGTLWGKFHGNPQFFDDWLKLYEKDEKSRAEAINEFSNWETIVDKIKEVADNSSAMKNWLQDHRDWKKGNGFFGRGGTLGSGYKLTFQNFSIMDVYLIFEKMIENIETYQKRKSDNAVSIIGQKTFGDTIWGKEFRRMGEDSEGQRVKQFEDNYGDLEAWDIRKYMYNSKDPDEVRACVNLLKARGFFKWDDPQFWMVLERLGASEKFNYEADFELPPTELQEKIRISCEQIWSSEVYRQWETSYEDDLNKAKSGWTREFSNLENNSAERTKILATMLRDWKNGVVENVDPARYEEFVFAAVGGGKMNGPSDKRWYFLVQGIATKNPQGQSLISRDALNRINDKYLAEMPYLEFFTDECSWKLNGEIVPENTPGAQQRVWKYSDYLAWSEFLGDSNGTFDPSKEPAKQNTQDFFYHYMIQSDIAMDRAGRMQRAGGSKADHDDGAAYMAAWTERQATQSLSSRSEGTQQYTDDFWRNFIYGFDVYAREMYDYIKKGNNKYGDDPNWENKKQKVLKNVGSRLRTAIKTTQILQGNVPTPNQQPLVFDKDDWAKDTDYSQNAEKSRKKINGFMSRVLSKHGALEKHGAVLNYMGVNISKTQDERMKVTEWTEMKANAVAMLSENQGGQFFNDTGVLMEVLEDYCEGGGEMALAA